MRKDNKYNILNNINQINNRYDKFILDWDFVEDINFDRDVSKFIKEQGILNQDVFYILDTIMDITKLKELKAGESIDFGNESRLEKIGNTRQHNYLYHNDKPMAFGMHIHLDFNETITPLKSDIIFYVYGGNEYKKFKLKVGEIYTVPKGVKHAVIFCKQNTIKLEWK